MNLQKFALPPGLLLGLLCLSGLASGCIDDDPCDPGQIERSGQCYAPPAPSSGGSAAGGSAATEAGAGGAADAAAGAPGGTALDTPFGSACEDTTSSSDCGGTAPVCADLSPLGQTIMCTQIDCADGEANAGICPDGFQCLVVAGYPSVCIKE
jgi:hypothetical protein